MPSYRISTPTSPSSPKQGVAFAAGEVTSISRPISNDEHWALWNFETHARDCEPCYDPYYTQRAGDKLCSRGHTLAVEVAKLFTRSRSGTVYSTEREADNKVRLEIPTGFEASLSLLSAIERGVRYKDRFVHTTISRKERSADDRKVVERAPSVKKPKEYRDTPKPTERRKSKDADNSKRASAEIVDWPQEERKPSTSSTSSSSSSSERKHSQYPVVINNGRTGVVEEIQLHDKKKSTTTSTPHAEIIIEPSTSSTSTRRGSHYQRDIAEQEKRDRRNSHLPYKLEVREPTPRASESGSRTKRTYRIDGDRYWS